MLWMVGPSLLLALFILASPARTVPHTLLNAAGNTPAQIAGNGPQTGSGGAPLSGQSSPDADTLKEMEADYLRAEVEDSAQLASRILADDFVEFRADGTTETKTDILNHLNQQGRRRVRYNVTAAGMKERFFGDTACVTYTKIYTLPNHGSLSENVLHIFTKRNGVWHLQVSSPIPKPRLPTG